MATLAEQETFYDINPINPTVITEPFTIVCTDTDAVYQIGDPDDKNRRGFIVTQDSDIVVVNSSGGVLVRGVGFFTTQRTADVLYSKTYVKSVYSGIKFAALGTYTVTKHIQCGTYPKAAFFNWATLQIKSLTAEIIPSIQMRLTSIENTVVAVLQSVAGLLQTISNHESRIMLLESNPTIIVVADHATMLALTGLKTGTTVYVVSDTNGKRAGYLYDGTAFQKTSDPDWENINIDWSALLNIPAGVAALISGTLKSTALADAPQSYTAADAGKVLTVKADGTGYELTSISAAAGVGDVSSTETTSTIGYLIGFADTLGKKIKSLAVAIGHNSGNVPLSDGVICTGLNAEMVGGAKLSESWKFLPLGTEFVQRMGRPAPVTLYGGGTWSNVSSEYAGLFERIEGGNAAAYGSTQGDAIRDMVGEFKNNGLKPYANGSKSGVFANTYGFTGNTHDAQEVGGYTVPALKFQVSAGGYPTAVENRPVSATTRIWRLTAY